MTATKTEDRTNEVLQGMMREGTGAHMLDSGGAYGRHWEHNQRIEDFDSIPEFKLKFRRWGSDEGPYEIDCVLNVYHWLKERVTFLPELQAEFDSFCDLPENEDSHWLQLMEGFAASKNGTGLYGEGEPITVNTYNGEDILSQAIQYVYWENEDRECFVLLQLHNGCDVRGGYTAPKAFSVSNDEYCIWDNARATISCSGYEPDTENQIPGLEIPQSDVRHYWDTYDGGYTWRNESGEDYRDLLEYPAEAFRVNEETHEGSCPICGGKLTLYSY